MRCLESIIDAGGLQPDVALIKKTKQKKTVRVFFRHSLFLPSGLTHDVEPNRGVGRAHGDHPHGLSHGGRLGHGEVVAALGEQQGQRRGRGPADPLHVKLDRGPQRRVAAVLRFDLRQEMMSHEWILPLIHCI